MKNSLFILLWLSFAGALQASNGQKALDSLQSCLKTAPIDTTRANILNDISENLIFADRYEEAMDYALQAKDLSWKLNFKTGISCAFRRIGSIYVQQGDYPKALNSYLQAIKLGNAHEQFCANRGMGIVYYYQGDYKYALEYLFKSYNYKKDDANTCSKIGIVYFGKKNYKLSLEYFKKALIYYENVNDTSGMGGVLNNMGAVYEDQNKNDSALVLYFEALKMQEKVNDKYGISNIFSGIGNIYFKQGKYSQAIDYQIKGLELAKSIGNLDGISQIEKMLSDTYEKMGNKSQSFDHYKQYIIMRDSMFNEENTKKLVRTEMNFKFEKQEEIAKAEQAKKDIITAQVKQRQRLVIYSISGGLLLVLVFSIFLFRGFKKTQRQRNIISEQKALVDESRKEIMDNIHYAKRIQDAVMSPQSKVKELLPNSFTLNMPRDIISGDFLFVEKYNHEIIVAVADSTNHSVSGAMMSILNSNLLNEAVVHGIHSPNEILDYVNITLSKKFHQTEHDSVKNESDIVKDGMDLIIIKIDLINMKYEYAGAYNPLLLVRNNELIEMKSDKLQLGQTKEKYKNNQGELQTGDVLYLSSDGYADQFSSSGKKFMKKRFKELLVSINQRPIDEQGVMLSSTIEEFKNGQEQTDDILIMGIKI